MPRLFRQAIYTEPQVAQVGASLYDMAVIYSAHPTVSEMAFMAARLA